MAPSETKMVPLTGIGAYIAGKGAVGGLKHLGVG